jgi:hypothetical protein
MLFNETLTGSSGYLVLATLQLKAVLLSKHSRGLSGYRERRRVADSRGPVLVAGMSLNK